MMRWGSGLLAVTLAAGGCAVGAFGYPPAAEASSGGSQCLPLPAVTPSPSPSASASSTSLPVQLCVVVNPSQSSVQAGRDAGFVVQVEAQNGAVPDVSVTLTASAGHAVFTGLCPSGDGAASCQLGPLGTDVTPSSFILHAQIGTPSSGATRVSLTAAAAAATSPAVTAQATGTMTVTAAASKTPSPTVTPTKAAPAPTPVPQATVRPVIPNLGGLPATAPAPTGSARASTAPAESVSSLFPRISPDRSPAAASASPTPADTPADTTSPVPVDPQASGGGGKSLLTIAGAVLLGLIALALAGFLITTRRRRADE